MNHSIHYLWSPLCIALLAMSVFMSACSQSDRRSASTEHDVYERLAANGVTLVEPGPPVANFVYAVQTGNLVFLSGHGPDRPEGGQITGRLGYDISLEEAQYAAKLTGISLLASLEQEIGDLNRVTRIVKVGGYVNAAPGYTQHSQVINGFSDFMVDVFGPEAGGHARASLGMSSLPGNIVVEIDMVVEIRD